jgi:hypothetical protein
MGGLGRILGDVPVDGANAKGRMRREGAFAGRRPTGTHRASNQSDPEGIDNDAESGATKKKQPDTGYEECRRAESLPPKPPTRVSHPPGGHSTNTIVCVLLDYPKVADLVRETD